MSPNARHCHLALVAQWPWLNVAAAWWPWLFGRGHVTYGRGSPAVDTLLWPWLFGRGHVTMAVAHWPWTRYYGRGFSAVDMLLMAVAHWPWTRSGRGFMAVAPWPWLAGRGHVSSWALCTTV